MSRLVFLKALLPIVVLVMAWSQTGHATTLPTPGYGVAGEIVLLGKRIPLPPGEWRVASSGFGQIAGGEPGPYGAIGGILLMRPDDSAHEFLLIHTNAMPVRDGWGQPLECMVDNILFQSVGETRNGHNGCSFVMATRVGWLARAQLPALGNDPAVSARLPPWALVAGFRVSDRRDVLDIRYGIVPPSSLAASSWFAGAGTLTGPQLALVARLGAWVQQARITALDALRAPPDQVPPLPSLSLAGPPDSGTAGEEISALRLGLYKLATYRLPASLTSLAIGWALSGNFYTGVQVMLWQGLTHSVVYFGNEMAWEWPQTVPLMPFIGGRDAVATDNENPAATGAQRPLLAVNGAKLPLSAAPHVADPVSTYAVDGKLVPLPGDGWMVLDSESMDGITGTVLVRMDGNTLAGLAVAYTNQHKRTSIFGSSSECARGDIYFAVNRYDTPDDGYCVYGKQVIPGQATPDNKLWGKALDRLAAAGTSIPSSLMTVGMRVRTRENILEVRYYFTPTPELFDRDRDDTGLAVDPVAALQNWADLMQEPIELGVRGRRPAAEAQAPWPWDAETVRAAIIDQAHAPLLALAAVGALEPIALRLHLALADAALAARERQRWSLWSCSAYKVATYRAASYADSTVVSWLITGSVAQGFAFASINAVARPVMAYVNEIAWANSGIGKAAATLAPVDFPEIGRDFR